MSEFEILLQSKPNLSSSSKVQYMSHYKRITNKLGKNIRDAGPLEIVTAMEQIYNTPSSKWAGISVPIIIYQNNNIPLGTLDLYRQQILAEKQKHLYDRNIDKNSSLPSITELTNYLDELMNNSDYRKYVINYLLTTYGVRNEDVDCYITNNKKDLSDKSRNYLLVSFTKVQWIRNVYKTANTYGQKIINIKNINFIVAINELPLNEWLLVDTAGNHIAPSSVGNYIQNRTYKNIGEGDIFKVLVKTATNSGKNVLSKLKQLSDWRGTDISTIASSYDIDLE